MGHTDCLFFSQSELVTLGTKVATFRYSADGRHPAGGWSSIHPTSTQRNTPSIQCWCTEGVLYPCTPEQNRTAI